MDLTSILVFLAIGAVAGWLAGKLMKGRPIAEAEFHRQAVLGVVARLPAGLLDDRLVHRRDYAVPVDVPSSRDALAQPRVPVVRPELLA